MFRWIIGSSLQFRFLVAGLAAALVIFGAVQLQKTPIDVLPEFAPPIVEVQTEAIGLSAEDVDRLITLNLEELLSAVPWLETIRSESVTGLSSILLQFEHGTNLMRARQMVQERLTLAYALPNVADPPVILQPTSTTQRVMMVGISSDKIDPTELSMIARWTIKPRLLGVPGVANVAVWGQRLRQMHVQIDPNRLRDAQLVQDDIITAAGDALWVSPLTFLKGSAPGTGGWIDNPNQRLGVHHAMPIKYPQDMAKIALSPPGMLMVGKSMALGEVAELTFSHPPEIGGAVVNGEDGLMLVIEKLPSANTLEVTRGLEQALGELGRGLPGVTIDPNIFRLAGYVEGSLDNLGVAMLIGFVLVLAILTAFLFNWRSTLISAITIPLSIFAAALVLHFGGATINVMILAGLVVALAVIIDDAVVDVDALMARLRRRADGHSPTLVAVVRESLLETRTAALYPTLIVILAVTPVFFMGGLSGRFFEPLAWSYVLAVIASMLVALTVTPALTMMLAGRSAGHRAEPPLGRWLRGGYETVLRGAAAAPRAILAAVGVLVVAGAATWPFLGQSLLPSFREGEVVVNLTTAPGTSYAEMSRITARVSDELRTLPGIRTVGAHVGRAITGDAVVGINSGQIWLGMAPDADQQAVVAKVRETIDGYPGLDRNVQSYLRDTVSQALTGASQAIVVRIYGQSRDILRQKAEDVRQALADVPGIVDLRATDQTEEPEIKVSVDLDAAGAANVKPGDVRRSSATIFSGLVVGYLFEEQKIFDVVVWGTPESRNSLDNLRDLWVERADRRYVRLDDVADVSIVPTPTVIRHERIAPYVDVVANIAGRDLGSVTRDVQERLQRVDFPLEYHPEVMGEYFERLDAQKRTLAAAAAALVGIYLLLQACFRSWRYATIASVALLASLAGGVLAVLATGAVVSLGSVVGLLAVLGISARNAVMLIHHTQHLERREGVPFGLDLVLRAGRDRLTPIVTSALAIVAMMVPILALGQVPGLEILQSTVIVIIGGLIASTVVTLFVLPALVLAFGAPESPEAELA